MMLIQLVDYVRFRAGRAPEALKARGRNLGTIMVPVSRVGGEDNTAGAIKA